MYSDRGGLNPPISESSSSCVPSFLLTQTASLTASDRSASLSAEGSKLSLPLPTRKSRHLSAPSDLPVYRQKGSTVAITHSLETGTSFPSVTSDDDGGQGDWMAPDPVFVVQRAVSVGSKQYGFTSLGRGFNWLGKEEEERNRIRLLSRSRSRSRRPMQVGSDDCPVPSPPVTTRILDEPFQFEPEPQRLANGTVDPDILTPATESSSSTQPAAPTITSRNMECSTLSVSPASYSPPTPTPSTGPPSPTTARSPVAYSPTSPRPPSRRRSSHKRVSLVAGRLRVIEDVLPLPSSDLSRPLARSNSQSSLLSAAVSTRPPSPLHEHNFLGNHDINDFVIEGEAGRGAYGMVKRSREKLPDGKKGVSLTA